MNLPPALLASLVAALLVSIPVSCETSREKTAASQSIQFVVPPRQSASQPVSQLRREINLEVDLLPRDRKGRRTWKKMRPRYITIHSTQNDKPGADARRHALALQRGKLRSGRGSGYLTWHFTVDDKRTVQHLPTTEQGEHADLDGPGNRTSIGIEICENEDGNLSQAIDRAAKLAAVMMKAHKIPLSRVVPHYHWPRPRYGRPWHKPCPLPLLDNGRPGRKWQAFKRKVNSYYRHL